MFEHCTQTLSVPCGCTGAASIRHVTRNASYSPHNCRHAAFHRYARACELEQLIFEQISYHSGGKIGPFRRCGLQYCREVQYITISVHHSTRNTEQKAWLRTGLEGGRYQQTSFRSYEMCRRNFASELEIVAYLPSMSRRAQEPRNSLLTLYSQLFSRVTLKKKRLLNKTFRLFPSLIISHRYFPNSQCAIAAVVGDMTDVARSRRSGAAVAPARRRRAAAGGSTATVTVTIGR
jgi:hypothetical protein